MLTLLFSADHELYLGENFLPEEEVLLAPTRAVLERCQGLGVPLTLFTDLMCWERYRALGQEAFPRAVEQQLQEALAAGHDVQAHLHPHWQVARPSPEGWVFPPEAYLLRPEQASAHLARARHYLEGVLRPVRPEYRCLAFRAGGYGVQPHAKALFAALEGNGYVLDSSLIPDYRSQGVTHTVDFGGLAHGGQGWWNGEHGLERQAPSGSGIFEIPIPGVTLEAVEARRLLWREALRQAWGVGWRVERCATRGRPCFSAVAPVPPDALLARLKGAWWRWHGVMGQRHVRWELQAGVEVLMGCLELYLERHGVGEGFFSLNMHPKGMGAWHVRTLEGLVGALRKRWGDGVRFLTFSQAAALVRPVDSKKNL